MPALSLFLIATVLVLASAFGAWIWHLRLRNAGVIDVVWGANQALAAALYAILAGGWGPRRLAVGLMVGVTGARLTWHLARRVVGHPEEGRYVALRNEWGVKGNIDRIFLLFFLVQGLLVALLSWPWLLAAQNPAPGFAPVELAALALFALGFLGQTLADAQLAAFKRDPAGKGKACRAGLWRYSRHPNYFFEWLMWVAYVLLALGAPLGWTALYAPLLMLHFLLNVTGVRYTEEQCLRSRGEDYARYVRETSPFIPWFPKSTPPGRDGISS